MSTQASFQSAAGSHRPDLMLRFQAPSAPREPVLWVEIKHGSPPHTRQLWAYADEQRERRLDTAAVLLVAPRAELPQLPGGGDPA